MSEQNKQIVRRFTDAVENEGNFAVADELLAEDFINHTPFGQTQGREAAKQFGRMLRSAFPDMCVTVEEQIAEGDRVVTRWTCQGTHEGEFQGMPPSGRPIQISGITIARLAKGKIIEQWANPDVFGLLLQLDAIPSARPTN